MTTICDSCHAGCCRAYKLTINVFDLIDLINAIGIEEAIKGSSFESLPFNPNYASMQHSVFPFIFDNDNLKGSMHALALKRVDSELLPGTLKCHFLKEENRAEPHANPELPGHKFHPGSRITAQCSVYEHRPTMCRTYPIAFNPNAKNAVLRRRENLPQASLHEGYQICPKQVLQLSDFGLSDFKDLMKKNNELFLNDARQAGHNQIVLKWNSQIDRKIENIVPFIMNEARQVISAFIPPIMQASKPKLPDANPPIHSALQLIQKKENLLKTEKIQRQE
jgi:Fe-S-cluster containining protein